MLANQIAELAMQIDVYAMFGKAVQGLSFDSKSRLWSLIIAAQEDSD